MSGVLQAAQRRMRHCGPATLCTWENCLQKWLNPNIGDLPLANVNNGVLKRLVAEMSAAHLSAKTIVNYSGLVKLVVASAKNQEGEPLFPREWDSEFIDLPLVENQRQPRFSAETMSSIVQGPTGQYRVLYALLAGFGLRVGEAIGLTVENISPDRKTLHIRQFVWAGATQKPKTTNAVRDVDLCPALVAMLNEVIETRLRTAPREANCP